MRNLVRRRYLFVSVPAGMILAALCVPLILSQPQPRFFSVLQMLVLPCVCIFLLQAALAWTPERMVMLPGRVPPVPQRQWLELSLLVVAVAGTRLALDPYVRKLVVVVPISSWGSLWRKFPFSVLVQPLFMVIAVYVFTLRLSRKAEVANAAVILAHQAVVVLQFSGTVGAGTLAFLVMVAGMDGLAGTFSYHRFGVLGPLAVAAGVFSRHAFYLMSS